MEVLYSGDDTLKLIDCVEAAKSSGKDAVLINLTAAEEAKACIEAAGDDMKVIFVNREPDDPGLLNENVAAVGSDERTSGRFQGEYLAEYFKGIGKTDVSYVLLRGTDGLVHTTLRSEGVISAMEEAGLKLEKKAVVEADYDRDTAKHEMDTVLPGIDFDCRQKVPFRLPSTSSKEKTWHRTPAVKFPLTTPTPCTSPLSPSPQRMSTNSECRQILNINEF